MGERNPPGLTKRGGIWHIDKQFRGIRICESTGTGDVKKAEEQLAKRISEVRAATANGIPTRRTFRAAAAKYLNENLQKKSIKEDAFHLKQLDPFIGELDLRQVHMGSLQPFITKRKADGVKTKTINIALAVVRHLLNLAASEWIDERGMTWLETAPKIKLFSVKDARQPYPLQPKSRRFCSRNCRITSHRWRCSR